MSGRYAIRHLEPTDFQALMEYDWSPLLKERDTIYLVMANDQGALSFVAEDEEGRPVGFLIASRSVDGARAFVWHLHVQAGWRKQGVGGALLERLEEAAARVGVTRIWLLTIEPTSAYYTRLGYTECAKDFDFATARYLLDVKKAVVMAKRIGSAT